MKKTKITVELPGQEPMSFHCDHVVMVAMQENEPVPGEEKTLSLELWQSHPDKPSHLLHTIVMSARSLEGTPLALVGEAAAASVKSGMAILDKAQKMSEKNGDT